MSIREDILRLSSLGHGQRTVARRLNISRWQVRKVLREEGFVSQQKIEEQPNVRVEFKGDLEQTIEIRDFTHIRNEQELVEYCNIDTDVWEIERFVLNTWPIGAKGPDGNLLIAPLYQVKAWLRRKQEKLFINQIKEDVLEFLAANRPKTEAVEYFKLSEERNMLEVAVYDIHLGQHIWHEETGQDYDMKIAEQLYKWSIKQHLWKARYTPIEKIVFVVGNDFYHIDNEQATTTHGTQLQADTRWLKVLRMGFDLTIWAVSEMLQIAPVDVFIVPGNHDRHTTLALGEMLDVFYHNNEHVVLDTTPRRRKYTRYGVSLIGFGHGNKEKPQKIIGAMPQEANELWSGAKFTEMHCGHYHHQKVLDPVVEYNGIVLRYMPTICATDAWHDENVFVGNTRTSQSFIWNYDTGLDQINFANLEPDLQ